MILRLETPVMHGLRPHIMIASGHDRSDLQRRNTTLATDNQHFRTTRIVSCAGNGCQLFVTSDYGRIAFPSRRGIGVDRRSETWLSSRRRSSVGQSHRNRRRHIRRYASGALPVLPVEPEAAGATGAGLDLIVGVEHTEAGLDNGRKFLMSEAPKAAISYSWDDEAHKAWVKEFATRLRGDGINVTLDQWHLSLGDRLPLFMEKIVRDSPSCDGDRHTGL